MTGGVAKLRVGSYRWCRSVQRLSVGAPSFLPLPDGCPQETLPPSPKASPQLALPFPGGVLAVRDRDRSDKRLLPVAGSASQGASLALSFAGGQWGSRRWRCHIGRRGTLRARLARRQSPSAAQ